MGWAESFEFLRALLIDLLVKGLLNLVRGRPVFFAGWGLRNAHAEAGVVVPEHRRRYNGPFWEAFRSGRDLTLITIKSLHTRNQLEDRLKKGFVNVSSLRILTLDPYLDCSIFESLARLLNEPVDNCQGDVEKAYMGFRDLQSNYPIIEVRTYRSIPTMQGLLVGRDYVVIEQLTYQSSPDDRMALILPRIGAPNAFALVQDRFQALWRDATPIPKAHTANLTPKTSQ